MNTHRLFSGCISLSFCLLATFPGYAAEIQRTYFIGNSLTMSTTLDRVHRLFEQRDIDLQFGSSLSGGKSLIRHLNYRSEPGQKWTFWETDVPAGDSFDPNTNHWQDQEPRFGRWDQALREAKWDQLVLQIYGSTLHDDLLAISAFIDLSVNSGATRTFYIYSTWPLREVKRGPDRKPVGGEERLDYPAAWSAPYTADAEAAGREAGKNAATRDYLDKLYKALSAKYAEADIHLRVIPVGEVLNRIDALIKAEELPGLWELARRQPASVPGYTEQSGPEDGVNLLYADRIHFNHPPHKTGTLGIFITGTTLFTVLSGQSPVGMSAERYGLDDERDAALIRKLQQTIRDVVTADPRTGRGIGDSPVSGIAQERGIR